MIVTIEDGVDGGIIEDAWLYSVNVDLNYGGRGDFSIGKTQRNAIIKVDLSGYSNIDSVITSYFGLNLYAWTSVHTIRWYEVLIDWLEGTKNGAEETDSVSWNSAKHSSVLWNTPGCKGSNLDRSAVEDGNKDASGIDPDWQMIVSNTLALKWATDTNYGLVMESADSTVNSFFYSSSAIESLSPYFYIEYIEAAPTSIFKDISKKDRNTLSTSDDITYVAPEAADADTRYEVASEEVEEESNINHYLAQYKKIVETSDQVAEILDERCKGFTFKFEQKKMPALAQAIRKVFGKDANEITYEMYKQVLEEQMALNEKIGDEIFAQ